MVDMVMTRKWSTQATTNKKNGVGCWLLVNTKQFIVTTSSKFGSLHYLANTKQRWRMTFKLHTSKQVHRLGQDP